MLNNSGNKYVKNSFCDKAARSLQHADLILCREVKMQQCTALTLRVGLMSLAQNTTDAVL